MTIREQQEALEHEILSPRATFADETRGRERPEEECPMRTPFQRDRELPGDGGGGLPPRAAAV